MREESDQNRWLLLKHLDLRKIPCPRNTSKALIFLSGMDSGETLEIYLDDGEPIQNVPSSLTLEGHKVTKINQNPEGFWVILVLAA